MSDANVPVAQRIGLEDIDARDFEGRVGRTFLFRLPHAGDADGQNAALELVRVTRHPERPPDLVIRGIRIRSKPFSILFRCREQYQALQFAPALLEDPAFEAFELLLAGVTAWSEDPGYFYYEAIFN